MKKLISVFSLFLVFSCATVGPTGTYVEPFGKYSESYSYDVNASFDEAWSALIDYSSTAFFGIDNFEKESGLLTLSFGVEDPNQYLDCGTILVMNGGNVTFDGSYVDYARIYNSAEFTGLMNISVRDINENTANIRVNTRYIFTTTGQYYDPTLNIFRPTPAVIFSFDSGSSDTEGASTYIEGTGSLRTCMPTYKAEKAIIDFIKNYR
tara:strand:+ start:494 stop:1117 length:624 start_codon:yes stop_codon:yes gene_type:complete